MRMKLTDDLIGYARPNQVNEDVDLKEQLKLPSTTVLSQL
jgi:hypothetical protein